jgi:hypothetical protein
MVSKVSSMVSSMFSSIFSSIFSSRVSMVSSRKKETIADDKGAIMKVIKDYIEVRKAVYKVLGLDEEYYHLSIEEDAKWDGNRDFMRFLDEEGDICSEEVKRMIVSEKHVTFLVYGCMGDTYYIAFDKANRDEDLGE